MVWVKKLTKVFCLGRSAAGSAGGKRLLNLKKWGIISSDEGPDYKISERQERELCLSCPEGAQITLNFPTNGWSHQRTSKTCVDFFNKVEGDLLYYFSNKVESRLHLQDLFQRWYQKIFFGCKTRTGDTKLNILTAHKNLTCGSLVQSAPIHEQINCLTHSAPSRSSSFDFLLRMTLDNELINQ